MTRAAGSLPPEYFEALYAADADPWKFATSPYERDKYATTLAALGRPRYAVALEVGCSIGVLTRDLARRCDRLLAVDVAEAALSEARRTNAGHAHVRFRRLQAPDEWPTSTFDLMLFSEVLYYLDRGDLERLATRVETTLRPDGEIVLVHWTGETDYPLTGDAAAEGFLAATRRFARVERQERYDRFRLDRLRRS